LGVVRSMRDSVRRPDPPLRRSGRGCRPRSEGDADPHQVRGCEVGDAGTATGPRARPLRATVCMPGAAASLSPLFAGSFRVGSFDRALPFNSVWRRYICWRWVMFGRERGTKETVTEAAGAVSEAVADATVTALEYADPLV